MARFTLGFLAGCLSLSAAQAQFVTVDLSGFYNADKHTFCCESAQYPTGNATYFDIPFYLGPATGNNLLFLDGTNPVTFDIPVNHVGVQRVRTLMNTAWGQPGPNSYMRIEFHGLDGTVSAVDLVGSVHIRDHGPGATQDLNQNPPTCTRNVWRSSGQTVKADMQTFALPAAIREHGLGFIRLTDTGAIGFQRGIGFAITLDDRTCEANVNDDCQVDLFDYLDFVDRLASGNSEADFNGDGSIDFFDYLDFLQAFASGC